ncbi:hypothetical protein [Geoglobus acetivorans]|uniref:PIN domain-containing protein n=1 Tax=Geoglobus acetivorans TaxID=565033 RepID=A0ABZ3H053_GEOAI|nr:hypothetical protein [Geoglobus acetivorans]
MNYILDAFAVLHTLVTEKGADKVEELLDKAEIGGIKLSLREFIPIFCGYGDSDLMSSTVFSSQTEKKSEKLECGTWFQ